MADEVSDLSMGKANGDTRCRGVRVGRRDGVYMRDGRSREHVRLDERCDSARRAELTDAQEMGRERFLPISERDERWD